MAQKNIQKDRTYGKPKEEKKHLIDPKHKNTVWTIIIVIILLIFFIVNNTRSVPDHGPYPPHYDKKAAQERLK